VAIGVIFAFIPFQGRPFDVMIKNFFKAAFNPTQYVYQKMGAQFLADNSLAVTPGIKKQSLGETSQKQFKDF